VTLRVRFLHKVALFNARLRDDLLIREVEIGGIDIHLFDDQACHPPNTLRDVLAYGLGDLWNADAILHSHIEIDRSLALPHFDVYSGSALVATREASGETGDGAARAERDEVMHTLDLARGRSGNLRDNAIGDDGFSMPGIQLNCIDDLRWDKLRWLVARASRARSR
jgi:hypothetical protein